MSYPGRADSNGIALVILLDDGWTLTLQRHDFKLDETLPQYFGKELSGQDLRRLLPDWSTVTWWTHSADAFLPVEWTATSGDYFLRLSGPTGGGDTRAAVAAFHRLINE